MSCALDVRLAELSTLPTPPPYSLTPPTKPLHGRTISAPDGRTIRKLPPPPNRHDLVVPSHPQRHSTRPLPILPEVNQVQVPQSAPPTVSAQPVTYYLASSSPPPPPALPLRASAPAPSRIGASPSKARPCKTISLQSHPELSQSVPPVPPIPEQLAEVKPLQKRSTKPKSSYHESPHGTAISKQGGRTVPPSTFASTTASLAPSRRSSKHELTPAEAAEIARKLKQFELDDLWQAQHSAPDSDDDSSSDEEGEIVKSCGNEPFVVKGVVFQAADVRRISKRWSRRWILESKGRKSEVQDYSLVLKALREL